MSPHEYAMAEWLAEAKAKEICAACPEMVDKLMLHWRAKNPPPTTERLNLNDTLEYLFNLMHARRRW